MIKRNPVYKYYCIGATQKLNTTSALCQVYPPKLWELSIRLLGLSASKSAEFIPSGSKCAILCPLS